jgi:hypothetical protein
VDRILREDLPPVSWEDMKRHIQFQGDCAETRERMTRGVRVVIFAHQLHAMGLDDLAARLLRPVCDLYPTDDGICKQAQDVFAWSLGFDMVRAFAGYRNYDRALGLARAIASRFPSSHFGPTALRLAREIPNRREDFGELRLPTSEEWDALRPTLSEEEQALYLGRRLRLLNWYSLGVYGWVRPSEYDTQYRESAGILEYREATGHAERLRPGPTQVINPFLVLGEMEVRIIPVLAPLLMEDWTTLGFDGLDLVPVRKVIADVINGDIAKQVVCDVYRWEELSPEERESQVVQVVEWADRNKGFTEQERVLRRVRAARTFDAVPYNRLDVLSPEQKAAIVPDLLSHIDEDLHDYERGNILNWCAEHDPAKGREAARPYLHYPKNLALQMLASVVAFKAGDREVGLRAMTPLLHAGSGSHLSYWTLGKGVQALLATGREDDYATARTVLERDLFDQGLYESVSSIEEISRVLDPFSRAGYPDGVEWLLEALPDTAAVGGTRWSRRDYAAMIAARLVPALRETWYDPDAAPQDKVPAIARVRVELERERERLMGDADR